MVNNMLYSLAAWLQLVHPASVAMVFDTHHYVTSVLVSAYAQRYHDNILRINIHNL